LSRGSSTASKEVDAASLLGLLSVPPSSKDCCVQPSSKSNPSISYWQSTEAAKLFVPKNNETMLKAVEKQTEILKSVNKTETSYLNILDGTSNEDTLTDCQVFNL